MLPNIGTYIPIYGVSCWKRPRTPFSGVFIENLIAARLVNFTTFYGPLWPVTQIALPCHSTEIYLYHFRQHISFPFLLYHPYSILTVTALTNWNFVKSEFNFLFFYALLTYFYMTNKDH
jgi:hypothetical protein